LTVPHAAWFCFILIELFIKNAQQIINQIKLANLKSWLQLLLRLKIKKLIRKFHTTIRKIEKTDNKVEKTDRVDFVPEMDLKRNF